MNGKLRQAVMAVLEGSIKRTVPIDELKTAASMVLVHDEPLQVNQRLRELLEALSGGEIIKPFARNGKNWNQQRGLPEKVTVIRKEEDEEKRVEKEARYKIVNTTSWHPKLIAIDKKRFTETTLKRLEKLNSYLWEMSKREEVPHRERALQIFGDEKALDNNSLDSLAKGKVTLEDLSCRYCPEPLAFEPFSLNPEDTAGKPLLVVENSATYWSCCKANASLQYFAAVVYGRGNKVSNYMSVCDGLSEIETKLRAEGVWYFGDLDHEGLNIPNRIDDVRKKAGLSELVPALALYQALLAKGIVTDYEKLQGKHDYEWAREWLGHDLSEKYLDLVDDTRWPQEGLTAGDIIAALKM